jgi:hypothetical protein
MKVGRVAATEGATGRASYAVTAKPGSRWSLRWCAFAILAISIGATLRLMWGQDIEYKYDESFMFQRATSPGNREAFPVVGMASGAGVVNPGLSVWIFIALARLFRVQTPPELARAVQLTNVTALAFAMLCAFVLISRKERREWVWAIALACVNPFAVLFDRKIWAQSLLPLFCTIALIGWFKRGTRGGAFMWGITGAWLGQIHMSGFFFSASMLIWTVLSSWTRRDDAERVSVRWRSWAAGSLAGTLTLLPWFAHLLAHGAAPRHQDYVAVLLHNMFGLWYLILFVTGGLGLGMTYALGASEFATFLTYPVIAGEPTYLVALAHAVLFVFGVWLLLRGAMSVGARHFDWRETLLGVEARTQQLLMAGLLGTGILLVAAGFPIHRHYLIVTFPLQWLWVTRQLRSTTRHWNRVLTVVWLSELVISSSFLFYVHVHGGAITGDYGVAFSRQH